jgi:actin-related protein 3
MLRERGEAIALEDVKKAARLIKEKHGFVVKDGNLVQEMVRMDKKLASSDNPRKVFKKVEMVSEISKEKFSFDVGYERFLGP